jgi:hypothetical protein
VPLQVLPVRHPATAPARRAWADRGDEPAPAGRAGARDPVPDRSSPPRTRRRRSRSWTRPWRRSPPGTGTNGSPPSRACGRTRSRASAPT